MFTTEKILISISMIYLVTTTTANDPDTNEIIMAENTTCSLPKQKGDCTNFTVRWFFDIEEYGGCARFWYGGCGGNENRFNSKEECENVCVKPQGRGVCVLPKVSGPCEGFYLLWYYDNKLKNCSPFVYGGCKGNNNRFETREACSDMCVEDHSVENHLENNQASKTEKIMENTDDDVADMFQLDRPCSSSVGEIPGSCRIVILWAPDKSISNLENTASTE